jgi:diguanylate cyclase (GGDEF)-like protein
MVVPGCQNESGTVARRDGVRRESLGGVVAPTRPLRLAHGLSGVAGFAHVRPFVRRCHNRHVQCDHTGHDVESRWSRPRGDLHSSAAVSGVVHGAVFALGAPVADATAIDLLCRYGRCLHCRCLPELLERVIRPDRLYGVCRAGWICRLFHRATLLLLTLAIAAATTLALAIKLSASSGDVVGAACVFVGITVVMVAVPFVSHTLVHFLGIDVMDSDVDPLCGVLNRRGFYRSAGHLVAAHTLAADRCLAVTMVDLDHFKNVNDTYGHPSGDRALIAVGNVLRHHSGDSAVVARVGGEEFCIADIVSDDQINGWAEAVRNAVAALPFGITASLGVARLPLKSVSVLGCETIDDLIAIADAAMYDAKRSGGNQIREGTTT